MRDRKRPNAVWIPQVAPISSRQLLFNAYPGDIAHNARISANGVNAASERGHDLERFFQKCCLVGLIDGVLL